MSNITDYRSVYVRHIQSCYRCHPEAISFYDQLADYLQGCSGRRKSSLQEVQFFELTPLSSIDTYPKASPFVKAEPHGKQHGPRVGVLEGFPCPDFIAFLGAEFAVRPEFFIEHLPMSLKKRVTGGVYELPTLPSRNDNVVRVQFSCLIRSLSPYSDQLAGQTSKSMQQKRADVEDARLKFEKGLIKSGKYGATHIRRIVVHDHDMCSIEGMISFTIATQYPHWHGIFLTDNGRMNMDQTGFPWSKTPRHDQPNGVVPLIPYNLPVERSAPVPVSPQADYGVSGYLDQFHPLKNIVFTDEVDAQLMQEDPFFLLATVLTTSFLSWSQTLNFLARSIAECQNQLRFDQNQLQFQLGQLRQHVVTISRVKEILSENEHIIKEGGCSSWPRAASDSTLKRKSLIQRQLLADHTGIMQRCSLLIDQCESATTVLVSFAQLVVSEKGIMNANEVNQLTKMASIFIPMSFITGVFGMNVREWDPLPSWRWPFGTGIVLFCTTIFLLNRKRWLRKVAQYLHMAHFTRKTR
ncbi:uncharacterized protein N7482_007570 [Penicillium canariense]|uniref:Uncharacterized protein n=1 Tax=Penicillium canariense TaxID=189055 RepID=A0A9W9HZP3_9EURO|nr:uncharacterized protein N7482_007570 [Penicillium canariense]KAJ5160566.1 hypothetical protein N7482_007570 [Penicillium canariense]